MAKKYFYIKGKGKWANKLFMPDQQYKCWSLLVYPDQEGYSKILELKAGQEGIQGILNTIKKDDDGYNITFKRPTEKLMKGKLNAFLPPQVVDKDGQPWGKNVGIGNGSDVTCKIEWYSYKRPAGGQGSAIRLESVRIDNLVPFEKKDFPAAERKMVDGLDEQPAPNF